MRGRWLTIAVNIGVPVVIYYGLRAAGVSVYLALLADTLVSAGFTGYKLLRERKLDGLSAFFTAMFAVAVVVTLVSGDERMLLAKEGWVTAAAGIWFLVSTRMSRPLAYLFTRPLLEHRYPFGPVREPWEVYWERLPRFRRVWRVSSAVWGVVLLLDAAARVAIAYALPVDTVRVAGMLLYAVATLVAVIITNVHYVLSGLYNGWSSLYEPLRREESRA
ncbi:VC0807 family protein [Nonomuraea harbinensis]|uniref:VC0807 family protein n=1 Tax=Nonomuraea harbinensis TaxID=1286938 RepID=A0ABW1BPY2_9ACTN|nr:VC0807 family protein [Nonomuraea harbinensis]